MKKIFEVVNNKLGTRGVRAIYSAEMGDYGLTYTRDVMHIRANPIHKQYMRVDLYCENNTKMNIDSGSNLALLQDYKETALVALCNKGCDIDIIYWTGDECIIETDCQSVRYIREVLNDDGFEKYTLLTQ